ncbi:hypothetical protein [Azoarcus sp. DD4]|uniref:hypothetical protein n=1 Tax=Azoarcus sp. DD4 TaxID=2027405 RepID=UPI001F0CFF51|nr:hypothetical protein [Azoarcus sp. DD4]
MLCVAVDESGVLVAVDPQPVEVTGCSLVVQSAAELSVSPFALTPEQGSEVAGSILALWALAYVFRLLIRTLKTVDEKESES